MRKNQKNRIVKVPMKHRIILLLLMILFVAGLSVSDILLHDRLSDVIDKTVLGLQVGELATEDVIAEETVNYIDTEATEQLQQEATEQILPVFRISLTKSLTSLEKLERIKVIITNSDMTVSQKNEQIEEEHLEDLFTGNDLQTILSYSLQDANFLFTFIEELLIQIYEIGVYSDEELSRADDPDSISLIRVSTNEDSQSSETILEVEDLLTIDTLEEFIQSILIREQNYFQEFKDTVLSMSLAIATENVIYDSITTERRKIDALQNVSPVINTIEQGELILKEGFIITENDYEQIRALEQVEVSQSPLEIIGRILFYIAISVCASLLLLRVIPSNQRKIQYLYMSAAFVLLYLIIYVVLVIQGYSFNIGHTVFLSPIILFSMLLTIVINRNTSLIISGLLAVASIMLPEVTLIESLYVLAVGLLSTFIIENAKRRIDLVLSAFIVSLMSLLVMILVLVIENFSLREMLNYSIYTVSINLISGILVIIILPILEHLFNLPTDFRLIELTTMNSKTLKRMAVMARGTYSHSVAVADLAETACEAIGANHLIARVGAYYHDIGKIDQPEYFIENQTGDNKHDEIKPSLSVVVIKSHVKLGIEKAKSIGLPQEIIDIIGQHHGSDVISYFYREALMNNEKGSRIAPEDFSYNGTPPMSKEAAVVMLADSVDAASRTLKQPTTSKMEKLIWKIFMDKIDHRQLIHCDLSLHDLETIKNSFIIILAGRFHTRIEYQDIPDEVKK